MKADEVRLVVNENGRVVIPAQFRKALGISAGDELVLRLQENELTITTQRHRLEHARRLVRKYVDPRRSLADELIKDRREAARKER
jgi:AbrB family looped-hinge helix DNA binding protein